MIATNKLHETKCFLNLIASFFIKESQNREGPGTQQDGSESGHMYGLIKPNVDLGAPGKNTLFSSSTKD